MRFYLCYFFLFAAFFGGVVACTSNKEDSASALSTQEKAKFEEYKMEMAVGRSMAGYLLQFYGTISDQKVVQYVNDVGLYVASRSDAPDRLYMFDVLDTDAINAFSCPGGYILITKGALKLADSEAELAMILGHEIAHVERQHMFKTLISKSREKEEAKDAAHKKLPFSIRMRERVKPTSELISSSFTRYLASQGGIGLSVLSAVKSGINVAMQTGVGFDKEYEADQLGINFAVRAGYRPFAFTEYLERLRKQKSKLDLANLSKTHPSLEDRETRLFAVLKKNDNFGGLGAEGKTRFNKMKDRLLNLPKEKNVSSL